MSIQDLPKGALPDLEDPRDFKAEQVMGAPQIDWSKEFRLDAPPDEDQGSSSSCVSQAWSYYHWQVHRLNWSRRDLYSRIFLPQRGAYVRDGGAQIVSVGQAIRDNVPDPSPETENGMRDKTGENPDVERVGIEVSYFLLPN